MRGSAFQSRLERGLVVENRLIELLESRGNAVVRNGTEHTHPNFVTLLRDNQTDAAKFIRYAPDGAYLTPDGWVHHFDVKAANSIERDAYEVYCAYEAAGCRVLLFVAYDGVLYWQWLSEIRFLDSDEYVKRFPEGRRYPVSNGWICPRSKPGFCSNSRMSGTPYKYIDFNSMSRWSDSFGSSDAG